MAQPARMARRPLLRDANSITLWRRTTGRHVITPPVRVATPADWSPVNAQGTRVPVPPLLMVA